MRLILSRKGFDTSVGGVPSPILEDGRLVSLPMPYESGSVTYSELSPHRLRIGEMVRDLTNGEYGPRSPAHHDPDLERSSRPRKRGWRPAFGQSSAAAGHLDRRGVTLGDLFLFFGLFRHAECVDGKWRYVRGARPMHALFGWLRVGCIIDGSREFVPRWLDEHPHVGLRGDSQSRVYVAASAFDGGVFRKFDESLRLTAEGETPSWWRLPAGFLPRGRTPLSYHGELRRWRAAGDTCLLETAARGQEFVLDCEEYPEVRRWAESLIRRAA